MEMKQISDTTIKITIKLEDLEERGMEMADFLVPQEKTEEFFYAILDELEMPESFLDNGMLSFRVTPKPDRLDVFVTKSKIDKNLNFEDLADLPDVEELSQMSPDEFLKTLEKNIFEKFPKKWPKGPFGKPVRGERGNHDLPSGAKGGEKMDLEHHYRHKQHTFDAFCKRTIRNESANAFRQIRVQQDRFVSLSDLPEEGSEALATYDLYPWEYTSFPVDGDVILIKDDRLADALTTLPKRFRDILLMYWFLELADREIGEKLNLSRKTVNNRRQQAYELLKELMGGDANE